MHRHILNNLLTIKRFLYVLLLASALNVIAFIILRPWDQNTVYKNILWGDAIEYNDLASSLLSNGSFVDFDGYRTPGYPVFIALLYSISSSSIWFVLLIQIFLHLVSLWLVYKIALKLFSENVALFASLFFAIDLNQIEYTLALYTETLFIFLLLASVYYLINSLTKSNHFLLLLSAMFLGIATLVRPVTLYFPIILVFFILFFRILSPAKKILYSLLFCVVFIFTISPWLIHNYKKYGEAKITTQLGSNLLFCNVASTEAYKTGKSEETVIKEFEELSIKHGADSLYKNPFKNESIYLNMAINYIRHNFYIYCKRNLMGIINLYTNTSTKHIATILHISSTKLPFDDKNYFSSPSIFSQINIFLKTKTPGEIGIALYLGFYLLANFLFATLGIFKLIRDKYYFASLFVLIIIYFTGMTGIIGLARLRLPFMPFINILSAFYFMNRYKLISSFSSKPQG